MSYTEVHELLKLGKTFAPPDRFDSGNGYSSTTWIFPTQIIKRVVFHDGVQLVFVFDSITKQCRVFVESKVKIIDGKMFVEGGGEIGPAEWN